MLPDARMRLLEKIHLADKSERSHGNGAGRSSECSAKGI